MRKIDRFYIVLGILLALGANDVAHAGFSLRDCARTILAKLPFWQKKADPYKATVIIVDGYSSGKYLPPAFRRADFQIVHVHSLGKPAKASYARTFIPKNFDFDVPHEGDLKATLERLKEFKNIQVVLPGADSGVLFADELTQALKKRFPALPSNGIDEARKDKFLQNERLAEHGLDSAKQIKTSSVETALKWIQENGLLEKGPKAVVIKPLRSASTDGVYFCKNEGEVRQALKEQVGRSDAYGNQQHEVLIQEYLEGDEYVVNTTSRDGQHKVTDIWKYSKRPSADGKRLIYDQDVLLPFEGEVQRQLVAYHLKVLKALGIENGNVHGEIKLVPNRGPVLVEENIRMMGSGIPKLVELATGHSQIDRTVLAFADPEAFKALPQGYSIQKYPAVITLANYRENSVINPKVDEILKKLPGYVSNSFYFAPDQPLRKTNDLNTAIGDVWVAHEDPLVLQKTLDAIRKLEADGAFTLSR